MSAVQSAWITRKHSASAIDKIGTVDRCPRLLTEGARLPFTSAGVIHYVNISNMDTRKIW